MRDVIHDMAMWLACENEKKKTNLWLTKGQINVNV